MDNYLVKYLLFLLLSISIFAKDTDCINGRIRFFEDTKFKMINSNYCFDLSTKIFQSNIKCSSTCLVDSTEKIIVIRKKLNLEIESPLYQICRQGKGRPDSVEYEANSSWYKVDRCVFSDGSFQDINHFIAARVKYED